MIIFVIVILMIFTIKQVVTNHQLPSWSWSRSDQLVTRGLAILAPSSSLPSSLSSPPSSSSSLSLECFIFRRGELLGTFKNNIWYFMVLQTLWGGRDELVQLPYQCVLQWISGPALVWFSDWLRSVGRGTWLDLPYSALQWIRMT